MDHHHHEKEVPIIAGKINRFFYDYYIELLFFVNVYVLVLSLKLFYKTYSIRTCPSLYFLRSNDFLYVCRRLRQNVLSDVWCLMFIIDKKKTRHSFILYRLLQ